LYLMGDLEAARRVLEAFTAAGKADAQALTLLGNTYRQLGLLDESEQVLTKAVDLRPSDHFPRCGFGRTLLVKGLYEQAQTALKQAIQAGAPLVVRLDLAETYYRMGQMEAARALLLTLRGQLQEPYRALLLEYLLFRTGGGEPPPRTLIEAGLPFWAESAARFQHTPYGAALADDVYYLQTLSEE
jgi:Flp pilus assembly protein TadD